MARIMYRAVLLDPSVHSEADLVISAFTLLDLPSNEERRKALLRIFVAANQCV